MPHKLEVVNLISVEQPITTSAAARTLNESQFLIEADRVHANAGLFCSFSDVNSSCHTITRRIKPGVVSRVKARLFALMHRLTSPGGLTDNGLLV